MLSHREPQRHVQDQAYRFTALRPAIVNWRTAKTAFEVSAVAEPVVLSDR